MKTFIGSICAVCVIPLKDEATDAGADVYRSHVPIQIEAQTQEKAEAHALEYCRKVLPESKGYLDHAAQVQELEITPAICAQIGEMAARAMASEIEKGTAALSMAMPLAMPQQFDFGAIMRMAVESGKASAALLSSMLPGATVMPDLIGKMLSELGGITTQPRPLNVADAFSVCKTDVSDVENLSSDHKE